MSLTAMLQVCPVYDLALRQEGRTLYDAGSLEQLPGRKDLPLVVNHDMAQRIGTVRPEFFRHKDIDGSWHSCLADLDDPPPEWLKVGSPVSFQFIPLHRMSADGCDIVRRAVMLEVSILSPGVRPAEPRARVATLTPSRSPVAARTSGPGVIDTGPGIIRRPRSGVILGVR